MKNLITFVMALALTSFAHRLQAQTYTMDWATAFSPAWTSGSVTRSANNVNGSGVNCNVQFTTLNAAFIGIMGGGAPPMSPTVTGSYMVVGGSASLAHVALDFVNNSGYMDAVFTFSTPVNNVSFNIADIDRQNDEDFNYLDRVTITGLNGAISLTPTITKYDAVTNPNFIIISGNQAYVNPAIGTSGNTASSATDQRGTIRVVFGNVYLTSFRVRYDNYPGTQANPTEQHIALGNIRFDRSVPVPVKLTSFDATANDNGTVSLNWKVENEYNFEYYSIERSENGVDFNPIGRMNSKGFEGATQYSFEDAYANAGKYYYRLRMVDIDGTFAYTKVVMVIPKKFMGFKVYPTIFHEVLTIALNVSKSCNVSFAIFNMIGERIMESNCKANKGNNEFKINLPGTLPRGQYLVKFGEVVHTIAVIKK